MPPEELLDGRGLLIIRHGLSLHNYINDCLKHAYPNHKTNLHHLAPDPPLYDQRKPLLSQDRPGTLDFTWISPSPRLILCLPLNSILKVRTIGL